MSVTQSVWFAPVCPVCPMLIWARACSEERLSCVYIYVLMCTHMQPDVLVCPGFAHHAPCVRSNERGTVHLSTWPAFARVPSTLTCKCSDEQGQRSHEPADRTSGTVGHTPTQAGHRTYWGNCGSSGRLIGANRTGGLCSDPSQSQGSPPQTLAKRRVDHGLSTSVQVRALLVSDLS